MTTIKNSFIMFTLFILGCFIAVSCTDNSINQSEIDESINFQEFQQTLNSVFSEATRQIESSPNVTRNTISVSLREAYKEVLDDQANMSQFKWASKLVDARNTNDSEGLFYAKTETLGDSIIRSSESPADAIKNFDEYLADENLSDEERIELIIGKEFVSFLAINSEAIDESYEDKLLARNEDGDQDDDKDTEVKEEDGWWESWGKCAAATISGYGSGGLAGCATGAKVGGVLGPKGALAGCAVGGAVGAISGALGGAVAFC